MFTTCLRCTEHKVILLVDLFTLTFIPTESQGLTVGVKLVMVTGPNKKPIDDFATVPNDIRLKAHETAFLKINEMRHEMQNSAP